ncbi:flagellar basal-body MS-ring/collar protein FliF [Marinomonas mediterranea]|jgi:flagellar basal-body M-ring protein/flagellar hook-basal body protein (fliF)|uniref:Flagellar M-ring protein n=1 Tax=Marinomonas mediterranea (strain ATCC 700492 / JCM 21426 / NBRC 103028 / MMB-1) TaxID=717774 RepID=F2K3L5_MARM1|nr:flagellar basal-body MS-ring/collar protein FliF [Marinomonas mediterranea]ADZ92454.1 flagellar M-ring protein FliF [Marinomonas mediterranea MMB-1]WCN10404.1 flagellar basal body M-ring protein FliF [Marinomonas mediterranea]WCN14450.1 flagellar basal body M-ring protein FliF [Marinomonas mediterranea]WCN18502.1 flagellar basal body M-ring protein FliF [Marinomonas mediterranea MMB-1]
MDNVPAQQSEQKLYMELLTGFNKLTVIRQLALMVGLAASIAIALAAVLWSSGPDYKPVLSSITDYNADQIVEILNTNSIPFKLDQNTGALLVEDEYYHQARLKLAGSGIVSDKIVGLEIMDQDQALGTSQFIETARYRRGLEGELSRTITSLQSVKSARVHLAIPKESVFVRDTRKPTASVFLELYPGRRLDRSQVDAIVNLVASSISQLSDKDVTVVDQRGTLLTDKDSSSELSIAGKQFDYTRRVEEVMLRRVNNILMPVVGSGRFKAEVSADIDFTAVEQTDEQYNPDLLALRSEQTLKERRSSAGGNNGVPGALTNQPPGAINAPEQAAVNGAPIGGGSGSSGTGQSKEETTRNFELDRSISYTKRQQGTVRRLSVAVVVDDVASLNTETSEIERAPWSDEELSRLTLLVRDAVGYDPSRGDSVSVINSPFALPEPPVAPEVIPFYKQTWFLNLLQPALVGLFILILLLVVVRPILKTLSEQNKIAVAEDTEAAIFADETDEISDDQVSLVSAEDVMVPGSPEKIDRQLNAIRGLIAEEPERVAQVVKQWVMEG